MAKYNEILAGRFNRALQKFLSMKGESPSPQLASEIMAVIPLFFGPENRYLEGWDRFGFQAVQAAAAGFFTQFRWRNPQGSGMVAIFEKLQSVVGPTDAIVQDQTQVQMGTTSGDLTTVYATQQPIDGRGRQSSSLIISSQTNAGTPGHNVGFLNNGPGFGSDFILTDDQELTLLPGQALQLSTSVVNVQLDVGAIWRERALEDSEKF